MVVPFLVAYHSKLCGLSNIMNKKIHLLKMNNKVNILALTISFRSSRKISNYKIGAKQYQPGKKLFKCVWCVFLLGERGTCEISNFIFETDSFYSTVTGKITSVIVMITFLCIWLHVTST